MKLSMDNVRGLLIVCMDKDQNNVKAKVRETMEKAFWDGIAESVEQDEPDFSWILKLIRKSGMSCVRYLLRIGDGRLSKLSMLIVAHRRFRYVSGLKSCASTLRKMPYLLLQLQDMETC